MYPPANTHAESGKFGEISEDPFGHRASPLSPERLNLLYTATVREKFIRGMCLLFVIHTSHRDILNIYILIIGY